MALLALLAAGCGATEVLDPASFDPQAAALQGELELPAVVWDTNPRAQLVSGELHAYRVFLEPGAVISLRGRAAPGACGSLTPALGVFGPDEEWVGGAAAESCARGAEIEALRIVEGGEYRVLVAAIDGGAGAYRLEVDCDTRACTPPARAWEGTRIPPAVLASESSGDTFRRGEILFDHVVQVREGLGNGWAEGHHPPRMNAIHDGARGGPDAQSCVSCHNVGGDDGCGTRKQNIFQAGDGVTPGGALLRNPPPLRGGGVRQRIAAEMTDRLRTLRDEALAQAAALGEPVTMALCAPALDGEVCFGSLVAEANGEVDHARLEGIDEDLVVRPFGWKGREATLRDFVTGGFRVHFGLQAEGPLAAFCAEESVSATERRDFVATWGDGPCRDPDRDGIERELTGGQLGTMAVYLQLVPPPAPSQGHDAARAAFAAIGCASCHTRGFALSSVDYVDPQTGSRIVLPGGLAGDPHAFEVWSDFKRHYLGRDNGDEKDFPGPAGDIAATEWVTAPLWDLARCAPYMHDGRAHSLEDAILLHDGEAAESRAAYQALDPAAQSRLLDFLTSLGG